MLFCPRALRRALRCGNSRSLMIDLFFILLFILTCSVVASNLQTEAQPQHNIIRKDVQNELIPEPNMLQRVIDEDIVKVRQAQLTMDSRPLVMNEKTAHRTANEMPIGAKPASVNTVNTDRKEIDGVPYPLLNSAKNFIPIRRIVHIDLKGGALKVGYLNETFKLLNKMGATGILLEWEDMFPFTGRLAVAVNGDAYTPNQVEEILQSAKRNGLDVIPLVQTFGHLEWILKLQQFSHLREASSFPQVICFASDEAWKLLQDMLEQVIAVHAKHGMRFFHMGADEVFQLGYCNASVEAMRIKGSKERAMLWHMARVAEHIKAKASQPVSVLAWHDMLTEVIEEDIKTYRLQDLIEPVLWSYAEDLNQYLSPATWYALKPFPRVWGSSAFKGADGPMRYSSNPIHYIRNNEAWTAQMTTNYREFEYIQGLILTGWSRYDHLAILCELLPIGVPSLAMSLESVIEGRAMNGDYPKTTRLFMCTPPSDPGFVAGCRFPGSKVYELINEFWNEHEQAKRYIDTDFDFNGWMSEFAERRLFSSPMYIEKVQRYIEFYLSPMLRIRDQLRDEMGKVFFNDTVAEFLETYVDGDIKLLQDKQRAANQIFARKHFPKRPIVAKPSNV